MADLRRDRILDFLTRSANTGRLIGTDLSRSVVARLVFMNGASNRIATPEETNARMKLE
jgi:hypothetical protein